MTVMQNRNISKEPVETPFSVFLWGGHEKLQRRKLFLKEFTSNPIFSKTLVTVPSLARKDAWTRQALQARELIRLKLKHGWHHEHFMEALRFLDFLPVEPQFRIFYKNLERQMSDEQKKIWLPKAERFEIFGSYSQTELGHGSNLRGLETTATFNKETDEFIINSPTLSSTKYWIGSTGIWATHSLVVANLIIDGTRYGNHLFLTQLRSLDTQELMPGIEIYDLGPKVFQAMLGIDNGALQFHNVRIPHSQMLARNAQVTRDGVYIPPKPTNLKHSYGSMITVRSLMAQEVGWDLLKAVAVAYHYTTFRKQFWGRDGSEEKTVFQYASVKQRLLPLLAQATALVLVGQSVKRNFEQYSQENLKTGDTTQLEDLHLQTVGAKVYSTEITARGIETCRIACGGHGFNALAGFGRMYANSVNTMTYEGDNYVLAQQVPRAILKHWNSKTESSISSLSYLETLRDPHAHGRLPVAAESDWYQPEIQRWVLEKRLASMVQDHHEATSAAKDTSFSSHALTMAHCDLVYWKGLWKIAVEADPQFQEHLTATAQVYSLATLVTVHKDLVSPHALTAVQTKLLRSAYDSTIENFAMRHVQELIDAYGFTEYEMDSALARADQTPYEALLDGAKASEMNRMQHMWPTLVDTRNTWKHLGAKL